MTRLIDLDDDRHTYCGDNGEYELWSIDPDVPVVDAIPIEYICPRIETLNKYISKWGGSFEHEEMVNAYIHEVSALVRLIADWRKEE